MSARAHRLRTDVLNICTKWHFGANSLYIVQKGGDGMERAEKCTFFVLRLDAKTADRKCKNCVYYRGEKRSFRQVAQRRKRFF